MSQLQLIRKIKSWGNHPQQADKNTRPEHSIGELEHYGRTK